MAALGGAGRPLRKIHFRGCCGSRGGREGLRHHVKETRVRQIVVERVIEGSFQNRGFADLQNSA